MNSSRDLFICHASEDKEDVIRPIENGLKDAGITYWFDEVEINWGDSITKQINKGLKSSKYVLVVVSKAFMNKHWPQRELNAALNTEASSGRVRVLPLIVGTEDERKKIIEDNPLWSDKQYLVWDGDVNKIINALQKRLLAVKEAQEELNQPQSFPMPKIRPAFTQRDKDKFLKEAFETIRSYFKQALDQLSERYEIIETEFEEINKNKFVFTIYRGGEVEKRCKVWIGSSFFKDAISYHEGRDLDPNNDNSFSEGVTISSEESMELKLDMSGFSVYSPDLSNKALSPEEAAERLWLRVIENLK